MNRAMTTAALATAVALAGLASLARPAAAQSVTDIEVPAVMIEQRDGAEPGSTDDELDLANIVQSAAKGVTTVQEAPAIVTVITADEIRDRQFRTLEQLIDSVPGWQKVSDLHSNFPSPTVRGQVQAAMYLHDGLSLFDPFVNVFGAGRTVPMELVKRVELITGPGGVLWGSNSLLGILNVITKDADDIDGIEVGGQIGSGSGDRLMARTYALVGEPDLLNGRLKLFAHASVETYQGLAAKMPLLIFHNALPQPNSPNVYGPLTETDQPQSVVTTLDGKLSYGKLQLRVMFPFGKQYTPMGLSGNPVRKDLPQDHECAGTTDPVLLMECVDPRQISRQSTSKLLDRYAVLEYRTRFADEKAGLTARVYGQQFVRGFNPLQILAPSEGVKGGAAIQFDDSSMRVGAAFDGDVEVSSKLRVLYGGEGFHERGRSESTGPLGGTGVRSEVLAPYNLNQLAILCPRRYDPTVGDLVPVEGCHMPFAYDADRTVFGAYLDPQFRPSKELIFDLGGRVQVAPGAFGNTSYDLNTTLGATVVWNFIPNWHLKVNYAQGFRPPAFNNTSSNGEALQIAGNPALSVETSDAIQGEINARIFKGERRIRELSFRIDGSYTRVQNLIQVTSGNYENSGDRGIASGEFLGKLYIQGGHRLELGYTYMRIDTSDRGPVRMQPEHWFSLAGVWSLIPGALTATSTMRVTGAAEDANRLVEYRGTTYVDAPIPGTVMAPVNVLATDLVFDRLPPIADLTLGLQYSPTPKLQIRAIAYNALFSHQYQPDVFGDYEPHLEYLPNPYEGFRAYLSMSYQY